MGRTVCRKMQLQQTDAMDGADTLWQPILQVAAQL
ncbi:hypothetical protein J3R74_000911 [Puniceicoccus vermicola]